MRKKVCIEFRFIAMVLFFEQVVYFSGYDGFETAINRTNQFESFFAHFGDIIFGMQVIAIGGSFF